jgi:uncharacterized protein
MKANTNFHLTEKLTLLPVGSIRPGGWLREQMHRDLTGFVGNLDRIVPNLMHDPIYGSGRIQKHTPIKDLGNLKSGDAAGDEQYKWWNSETQSNWWDGYMRHAFLLHDEAGIRKAKRYVEAILDTQDDDGYIGIYGKELRYAFDAENGELWAKASLYRALLAYYECTNDATVFRAVERAVDNVMHHYPAYASHPFRSGMSFNGGVSHGLTFTDVLERMYVHTQHPKYRDYARFLYDDFSNSWQSEADAQLGNILNPSYRLKSHGVHTFEHIRALIIATYASAKTEMVRALEVYLDRIRQVTTISGGAIGDEWISERHADATHTGYEYCSLQELLDSYGLLLQKTGMAHLGDTIENLFYNAAQGSRNPHHSGIAYLKTDNSFEMLGPKNGETEPGRHQTRYKYSPAHQDVAVCCNPNAGRIAPYFVQYSWMKEDASTLVATLLMPNTLETALGGRRIRIETQTDYPFGHAFQLSIIQAEASRFTLKIRKPQWATHVHTAEPFRMEHDYLVFEREFMATDQVQFSFETEVQVKTDLSGHQYYSHGALLYALPLEAREIAGKQYHGHFCDYTYEPTAMVRYGFKRDANAYFEAGTIHTVLINKHTGAPENVELVPFGKTILRQVTF